MDNHNSFIVCDNNFTFFLNKVLTNGIKQRIYALSRKRDINYRGVEQPGSSSGS